MDGPGDVARFFTPRGLAVSNSSAIFVADTGNQVLRRIQLPPVIHSITPPSARVGDTITINGERFDGRGPERNVVRFTRSQQAGGGQTFGSVTQATRTSLTVVVPSDAATGPVTVETEGGSATSPSDFVVDNFPPPVITDFTPKRGTPGMQVTLTGTNLKIGANDPVVTFAGSNGNRLPALVSLASATEVRTTVPNGAITGLIELSHSGGTAATATAFTVDTEQDFQLTVAPSATTAVQGGSGTYVIYVTSQQANFSQLTALTASGLPAGITVTFDPAQITAGASSTLTLKLSGTIAASSYPFTIHGVASVGGNDVERTAGATLNVMTGGQTTLSGRVLSTDSEPIIGATASLDGKTAMTDAAGSFLLTGVTAGTNRPLMVDGRTASSPNKTYPVIIEPANIVAGQANVNPYTFYLPPIDTQYEVEVVPGQNTVAGNPRVTGLQMTIPAGANLRNRDGSPVARVSITPLAIDRTPAPLPSNVATGLVYTSQPGGAISDVPMPVIYPNLLGTNPGTQVNLYAFNHDTVQWYIYGTGTVSSDGRTIAPDINPSTGQRYGLPDFSWHFPDTSPDGDPGPSDSCPTSTTGGPVDLSTGMKIEKTTDISFGGARGNLSLTRIYTTDLANRCSGNPFGCGTTHNFAVRLTGSWTSGGAGRLVMPDEATGTLFNYSRTDNDGALVFLTTSSVSQLGDMVRRLTDGTLVHRAADGSTMRFDSSGKLIAIEDRNGNTTTLSYTGSNLTRITDPVGRSIVLEYSGNQIVRATDPLGHVWRYTYNNTLSQLATVTDPLGNVMIYAYGSRGALTSITDARGNRVKHVTYDGNGRVIEQRFADGGVELYSYTLSGRIVTSATMTNTLGRTELKRFSGTGYVVGTTDALGQSAKIERNLVNNLPTSTVGSCGCPEAAREFDARGNMTSVTDQLGNTERYEYEPTFGNITKATDKLGRVTTYTYNSRGNVTSTTNALNQTTTYTYNQAEELVTIINPMSQTLVMEYDAFGNMVATVDALGNRTTMEYDAIGRLIATTDPLNRRSSMEYDALDRVVKTVDPTGAETFFTYDANGNLSSVKDVLGRERKMSYDQKNRLVSQVDQVGLRERVQYNTRDEVVTIISPSGRKTLYSYDSRGQLSTMTDSSNGIVRYNYDSDGNLTTFVDQRGNTTTYTYDELSRPVSMRNPLGQMTQIIFDAAGKPASKVDRLGRRTNIEYDAIDRPSRTTFTDATVTYSYDPASRLTRIDDSTAGAVEWTYDAAGRILSETSPAGTVGYGYNAADERIMMTAGDRQPVTYGYDSAGRLETITQQSDVFTYSYDQLSRLVKLDRANGVTTTYGYDAIDRLAQLRHAGASGQILEEFGYTYTGDDEISSLTSQFTSQPLASEKTASQADANNRIMQFGTATLSFDDEGKVLTNTDAQGGTSSYQWDARGRLTQVTLPNGRSVKHSYDALGRRLSRNEEGATTQFLYDGVDVVLDTNSDGSVIEYLNGAETDAKLKQTSATTGPLYFLQDHLGSTVALTNAAGSVTEGIQYEAFGASTSSTLTRYAFTGREEDGATGLLYSRARWYDPKSTRFISEDPSGVKGGLNFYAYVENDPINDSDPFGLKKKGQRGGGNSPGSSNPRKGRRYSPPTKDSHPPDGVKPGCTNGDSCPEIVTKMGMLANMISSHQNWDWDVPSPRGGDRHKKEIADLWRAWSNCQAIFARKCKGCPPPPPFPARNPQPTPRRRSGPTMDELRLQEESARHMVRFWETILYGSLIGGGIVLTGPAAIPVAGRALSGFLRGGGGRLVPVGP